MNAATGVGELTLGVGILASGALGAIGGFVGTGLWLLIDPPSGHDPVIESRAVIAVIGIALFVLAIAAGVLRRRPLVASACAAVAIGGFVGIVAGLVELDPHLLKAMGPLVGITIGLVDVAIFRRSTQQPRRPGADSHSEDR